MLRHIFAGALLMMSAPAFAQEAPATIAAVDYSDQASWLCLPGRADACGTPLPTTALNTNGYGSVGESRAVADAPVDCFYVYPTVSRDAALNSDMIPGAEEQTTAAVQFARFSSVCRPFAPLYRQMTLAALAASFQGQDLTASLATAYGDVLAAWREYLRTHNRGRPFVLVGHSQGSLHLIRLLAEEIEGSPAAANMLSAMLIGFNVEVPEGQIVGGTFRNTPLCTRFGETGCVVTYVSYRATNPPPPGAMLGRTARPGMTVACTNPARLLKRSAELDSYWFTSAPAASTGAIIWSSQGAPPTPFVRTEGLISGACVNRGQAGYLSVIVNADPADARTDRIPGDVANLPGWGLHLADMNLAQGDLIELVEAQARAFRR